MKYKEYRLPADLYLLAGILSQLVYYSLLIHCQPMPRILKNIKKAGKREERGLPGPDDLVLLDKIWRGCGFFLLKFIRTERPCLRRSLILYRYCCRHGIDARVIIGVRKQGQVLKGHSWILINGSPYREPENELLQYTPIMEG